MNACSSAEVQNPNLYYLVLPAYNGRHANVNDLAATIPADFLES